LRTPNPLKSSETPSRSGGGTYLLRVNLPFTLLPTTRNLSIAPVR
jgi:hypothetical protein